jgi:hypothetical protein
MKTPMLRHGIHAVTAIALVGATALLAAPAHAASWSNVLRWEGAVTQACQSVQADGSVVVQVRVNNRRGQQVATAGLNVVRPSGQPGNKWTYTRGSTGIGRVSDPVSLSFASTDSVYLLIGSRVGITGERTMPVSRLTTC